MSEEIIKIEIETSSALQNIEKFKTANAALDQQIAASKEVVKAYNQAIKDGNEPTNEQTRAAREAAGQIVVYTEAKKLNTKAINDNVKEIKAELIEQQKNVGSINEMRAQYGAMKMQYDDMSEAMRNTEAGQAMSKQLSDLAQKMNQANKDAGSFKDNIGRYQESILAAIPGMDKFDSALGAMGVSFKDISNGSVSMTSALTVVKESVLSLSKALLSLLMNPVVATIAAIVLVFNLFLKALKSTEEGTKALNEITSVFSDVLTVLLNAVSKVAVPVFKLLAAWLNNLLAPFVALINLFDSSTVKMDELKKNVQEAADLEIALQQRVNAQIEASARNDAKIADLRAKAQDSLKYTAKQRLDMIKEAMALSLKNAEDEKKIIADQIKLFDLQNKNTETSAKDMQKRSELVAQLISKNTEYSASVMEMTEKVNSFTAAVVAEAKALSSNEAGIRASNSQLAGQNAVYGTLITTQAEYTRLMRLTKEEQDSMGKNKEYEAALAAARLSYANAGKAVTAYRLSLVDLRKDNEMTTKEIAEAEKHLVSLTKGYSDIEAVNNSYNKALATLTAAQAEYNKVLNLTRSQKRALYDTEEAYTAAVLSAKKAVVEANTAIFESNQARIVAITAQQEKENSQIVARQKLQAELEIRNKENLNIRLSEIDYAEAQARYRAVTELTKEQRTAQGITDSEWLTQQLEAEKAMNDAFIAVDAANITARAVARQEAEEAVQPTDVDPDAVVDDDLASTVGLVADQETLDLEFERLTAHLERLNSLTEDEKLREFETIDKFNKARNKAQRDQDKVSGQLDVARVKLAQNTLASLASITSTALGNSKAAQAAQKVVTIATIAMDTAVGIANTVAQASKAGWPAMIPIIISGTASVLSGIGAAKSALSSAGESANIPTPTISSVASAATDTYAPEKETTNSAQAQAVAAWQQSGSAVDNFSQATSDNVMSTREGGVIVNVQSQISVTDIKNALNNEAVTIENAKI